MERGVNEGGVVTEEMVRQRCLHGNYIGCIGEKQLCMVIYWASIEPFDAQVTTAIASLRR